VIEQPTDPRTWTNWQQPERYGFLKADCDTGLEVVFQGAGTGWLIGGAVMLFSAIHPSRGSRTSIVTETTVPLAFLALAVGLAMLIAKRLTDNFYLVDPSRHVVYYHAKFLSFRRVRLFLERQDILAVSTATRRCRSKRRTWWEHRTVLIGRSGRIVPLANWAEDALEASNRRAKDLAGQLACPWHESPEECRLVVTMTNGVASVELVPFTWATRGGVRLIVAAGLGLLVVLAAAAGWVR
jgi:hypothetical protein